MNSVNNDLMEAAKNGYQEELQRLLLRSDCDPKFADHYGFTALMWAALAGRSSCVQTLPPLSDVLATDRFGMTALMQAAQSKNSFCLELLLPLSDALVADKCGRTALMWVAAVFNNTSGVECLLPASDAMAKDNDGKNALMWAASSGRTASVHILLPFSDTSARNNNGLTASAIATNHEHHALGRLISAYSYAMTELTSLHSTTSLASTRKASSLRI